MRCGGERKIGEIAKKKKKLAPPARRPQGHVSGEADDLGFVGGRHGANHNCMLCHPAARSRRSVPAQSNKTESKRRRESCTRKRKCSTVVGQFDFCQRSVGASGSAK